MLQDARTQLLRLQIGVQHPIAYRELVPALKKKIYTGIVGGKVLKRMNYTKHQSSDG
jgi:hypothetical protein